MYQNEFAQEFESALGQEQEYGGSQETFEFNPEFFGEMTGESYEMNGESYELSGELNELQEMELAHELLEINSEQELNMFLGKLIKSAGKAVSGFARSSVGKAIGGALKQVGKIALPLAGKAAGAFLGGPAGAMIGGKLGSMASNLFELELEGLSPEDQEFETARAFVRFGHSAASKGAAMQRQQPGASARSVSRTALGQAARQHAPGLLRSSGSRGRDSRGRFMPSGGQSRGAGASRRPQPGQGGGGQSGSSRGNARPGSRPGSGQPGVGPNFSNYNFGGSNLNQGGYGSNDDDDADFDPDQDFGGDDQGNQSNGENRASRRGMWQRRGRSIVIQL